MYSYVPRVDRVMRSDAAWIFFLKKRDRGRHVMGAVTGLNQAAVLDALCERGEPGRGGRYAGVNLLQQCDVVVWAVS